jgi:hypothetical protein
MLRHRRRCDRDARQCARHVAAVHCLHDRRLPRRACPLTTRTLNNSAQPHGAPGGSALPPEQCRAPPPCPGRATQTAWQAQAARQRQRRARSPS